MSDLFSYQFIAQAIGILGSALIILCFAQKSDVRFKVILILGSLTFALHFFLMGAFAGVVVNMLNALRVAFSMKFHKSTKIMLLFWVLYITTGWLIYKNLSDLLPVFAGALATYSNFKLSGIKLRMFEMIGASSWLIYGIIFKSIGGIITEIFVIATNSMTIFRLFRDKKVTQ